VLSARLPTLQLVYIPWLVPFAVILFSLLCLPPPGGASQFSPGALPKPNTMSPPAALRRVVGVVMAVAWLFAAPTLCSPAEVEEVACLEDFKLGARADAGRCARDCTSTSNRSRVFCLPRYDVAQCIRSCGAVPSRFPSLSPTQMLQQDWFLKWLYGGPAHSLTACGVATLSP
jgi:hypothetical protein